MTIRRTENSLRLFIYRILEQHYSGVWMSKYLDSEDIKRIEYARKKELEYLGEEADTRPIFYSYFSHLIKILRACWNDRPEFEQAFGSLKDLEPKLTRFKNFRDLQFHGRELLPHQRAKAIQIANEIRKGILKFMDDQEQTEAIWPRIETVRDNAGNYVEPHKNSEYYDARKPLRQGDTLEFVITTLPQDENIAFSLKCNKGSDLPWQADNAFSLGLTDRHVGDISVGLYIKGAHAQRRSGYGDFSVHIRYTVLPAK